MKLTHSAALILAILISFRGRVAADEFDPAPTYYNTATGTGATLKQQLHDIIDGHTVRSYDSLRIHLQVTDADVANPGHMFTVYDRTSLNVAAINPGGSIPGWDSGNTWNREHTWPQSRGVGSGGPDSSDLFNIRPALAANNGDRGNNNFGGAFGQEFGDVTDNGATQWYPGDADAGMIARQAFYMAVRYDGSDANTTNLELFAGNPSTAQGMGDLNRLIQWNYLAVPDDFERRRNEIIYDSYQYNRNPFTDHPEWAWSVFVDQQNDTQLEIADGVPGSMGNGGSTLMLDLGRVLVGAPAPASQTVTLTKTGVDGTYYSVTPAGGATSSISGRYNAFPLGAAGSRSFEAGLAASTAIAGERSGTITIDNLDVTTGGGFGRGANDLNDVITVQFTVFDHANPSFAEVGVGDVNELTIDFGTVEPGAIAQASFRLTNLPDTLNYTASADFDAIVGGGDTSVFFTDLTPWVGNQSIFPGEVIEFHADMITSTAGNFSATYALSFSDEDLPGAASLGDLTLNLVGSVVAAPTVSADFDGDGDVDGADLFAWQRGVGITAGATRAQGDANGDGAVDAADLAEWSSSFGKSPQLVAAIPEPTTIALVGLAVLPIAHRRYIASRRSM